MSMRLHLHAVGFAAPGIEDADALAAHLGGAPATPPEDWSPAPKSLSRRQMMRLSDATRVAIMAAEQIAGAVPGDGAWVFASSIGEGATLDGILRALCEADVMIQPLGFQNAVHNAAQGQWSILAHSEGPGTSIASYDDTAGAGLLKAAMQATIERTALGLVIYDAPLPPPLHEKRPIAFPMAAALALSPHPPAAPLAALEIDVVPGAAPDATPPDDGSFLSRSGNPTRLVLPLLKEVFRPTGVPVTLSLTGGAGLRVTVGGPGDAA